MCVITVNCCSELTSIVYEEIQSGLSLQEGLAEAVDGLETGQVQLHVQDVTISCFLFQHDKMITSSMIQQVATSVIFKSGAHDQRSHYDPVRFHCQKSTGKAASQSCFNHPVQFKHPHTDWTPPPFCLQPPN